MNERINTCEQVFCTGCIYDDGESCLKIVPPALDRDEQDKITFCAGLTYYSNFTYD